jgi:starvation-inducible DNA-binding protein
MKSNDTTAIGIDRKKSAQLTEKLNELLANYQVFYQNLRGFHWNIQGPSFFELHAKYEQLYTVANEAVDAIAERILTLEGRPMHAFSSYLNTASINEVKEADTSRETVSATLENLKVLIALEREILNLSDDADDEGTSALMSDYIREQEKTIWMLKAYLT